MHSAVYFPFGLTAVVVALSRLASHRLPPRPAAWAIVLAVGAVAISTVGALGLLGLPLLARWSLIAHLGRWRPSAVAIHTPVPVWLSLAALGALGALTLRMGRALRALREQFGEVVRAHGELARHGTAELVIIEDATPRAHAMSPTFRHRGRVIVTTAMLDLLDEEERAAVVAHERSHLRHAHGLFLAICQLAVSLNPILAPVRRDARFVLERWADEDAAEVTTRTVMATALAKAALATLQAAPVPGVGMAMHLQAHAVTDRVAALLGGEQARRAPLAWALIGTAALAAAALLWASHDTERFFEAVRHM